MRLLTTSETYAHSHGRLSALCEWKARELKDLINLIGDERDSIIQKRIERIANELAAHADCEPGLFPN